MHRFLIILLILLVPVRVFGAESMGICMHESGQQAQATASMPDDCPMNKTKHEGGCESCQLCMPLAGPEAITMASLSRPETTAPVAVIAHFRSAEIHRSLRPPIS